MQHSLNFKDSHRETPGGSEGYQIYIDWLQYDITKYKSALGLAKDRGDTERILEYEILIRLSEEEISRLRRANRPYRDCDHQRLRAEARYCDGLRGKVGGGLASITEYEEDLPATGYGYSIHASYEKL